VNTEMELDPLVGRECIGIGAAPEYRCLMVFFVGATLAVKFENGVMTWEVIGETVH